MAQLFRNIRFDWLGKRNLFFAVSAALLLAGAVSLVNKGGFLYGVDFKGGTIVRVRFHEPVQIDQLRAAMREQGAPDSQIQQLRSGMGNDYLIEFFDEEATEEADATRGREIITDALNAGFGDRFEILSATSVGEKVGADLRRQAVLATLYALGGMLIYIAFRFEWIYGTAAVFAVFHDAMLTLGFFSIFGREINLTVIAALLTLIGYSVNDKIVIFDRVRENLKTRRRDSLGQILNDSINQTLSRTVLTSASTFVTVLALFLFGGEIINNFAFAMVVGVVIGTVSTFGTAAPLVLIYTNLRGRVAIQPVAPAKVPRPVRAK